MLALVCLVFQFNVPCLWMVWITETSLMLKYTSILTLQCLIWKRSVALYCYCCGRSVCNGNVSINTTLFTNPHWCLQIFRSVWYPPGWKNVLGEENTLNSKRLLGLRNTMKLLQWLSCWALFWYILSQNHISQNQFGLSGANMVLKCTRIQEMASTKLKMFWVSVFFIASAQFLWMLIRTTN